MDWGIAFGLTGVGVGLLSLVYARTQAMHARRQADAAHLASTLEVQRSMAERIYQVRADLVNDPGVSKLYLDANPGLRDVFSDAASLAPSMVVRNLIDGLQDMYFLRKAAIVRDHHWRSWVAAFGPVARMPLARRIFDNAVSREALDPEFTAFLGPIFEGRPLSDPKRPT